MKKSLSNDIRFFILPGLLFFWFFIVICRLFNLHFGDLGTRNNVEYKKTIPAFRGKIYDRNGIPLALSEPGWRISIDPNFSYTFEKHRDFDPTCKRIAELVGKNAADVKNDFCTKTNTKYVVQGETYDSSALNLETDKNHYLRGVKLEKTGRRVYPHGNILAHILGFLSYDNKGDITGNGGIEQAYNKYLKGTDGYIRGIKTGRGKELRERRISEVPQIDGNNIYLTIDSQIQRIVYSAMTNAVTEWNADGGRAIVQMVKTGEILAMVSLPDYDPAVWRKTDSKLFINRCISHQYDPGSTMKAVTVAAAMQTGIITTNTTYDVGKGSWYYGGHRLRDHCYGEIDIPTVIKKSSNIASAMIALQIGNKRFENYLRAFGFGEKTEIDLPGEALGMLTKSEKWEAVKPTRIAIGQGISVTPLQMINAYSTIANGGNRMRPYIMDRIETEDGDLLMKNEPKIMMTPISGETAAQLREMLKGVILPGGTATRAKIPGYTVAGKTGTAQMIKPAGGYYDHNHWASFIGFLPAEEPVFSVLVLLDNPTKLQQSHDGGVSAAPAFSVIAGKIARYLEIPVNH